MDKVSGSDVNERKRAFYDLNETIENETLLSCSICLEEMVSNDDGRTIVRLKCDHTFHLDCIGSAFNAKNEMQCPNCRKVEKGRWLYARGSLNPTSDDWFPETEQLDPESPQSPEFPHVSEYGMELCPFGGSHQHNSLDGFPRDPVHTSYGGHQFCSYYEYNVTPPTGSNSSPLIPLTPIPINPRLFRRFSQPDVIIARCYFGHPLTNHSLLANAPEGNTIPTDRVQPLIGGLPAPAWHAYMSVSGQRQLGRTVSGSWSVSSSSNQVRENGFTRFNVWEREPALERTLLQHQLERNLARVAANAPAPNVTLPWLYPNRSSGANAQAAPYNTIISTDWVQSLVEDDSPSARRQIDRNFSRLDPNDRLLLNMLIRGRSSYRGRSRYGGRSSGEGASSSSSSSSGSG